MQIPVNSPDQFIKSIGEKVEKIRALFLKHVKIIAKRTTIKVMLGDGTVSDQETFDPSLISQFYENLQKNLPKWTTEGISVSNDQDLRRRSIKFELRLENYVLSMNMAIQYRAFLFYRLDHRVIEIQKELVEITSNIKDLQTKVKPVADKRIEEKLRQKGFENMDHQKLFEVLFENDNLTGELMEELKSQQDTINKLEEKRDSLFTELDNMLLEIYHTTPTIIDETRIIAAEEGCLCNFNLEKIKNESKDGNVHLDKMPSRLKEEFSTMIDDIIETLKI